MTPILTKTETTTAYGHVVNLIGEVYDSPIKQTPTNVAYSVIHIKDEIGNTVHPDFSFGGMMDEEHLVKTLEYLKKEINEKPEQFFPHYKTKNN